MKIFFIALFFFHTAHALELEGKSQGELSYQGRVFKNDHQDSSEDRGSLLYARIQGELDFEIASIHYGAFAKTDHFDSGRDILILQDLYLEKEVGDFLFKAGYQVFNWSATEAFHPADVVNSRNLDADFERPEKIGELTLSLGYYLGEGDLTFYYFPSFERPRFPGSRSRLGLGANIGTPVFLEDGRLTTDDYGFQWAVRFTQVLGDLDIAAHYFHRLDRQLPIVDILLRPHFFYQHQYGLSLQYLLSDSILFKFEGAHNDFEEQENITVFRNQNLAMRKVEDHSPMAASLEKSIEMDSGSQMTLILEYQHIFLSDEIPPDVQSEISLFQKDLLFGVRWALNDIMGQEFFSSLIADLERSHEYLFHFHYERRLSNAWKIKVGTRYIDAPVKGEYPIGLETFHQDHQLFGSLTRFF